MFMSLFFTEVQTNTPFPYLAYLVTKREEKRPKHILKRSALLLKKVANSNTWEIQEPNSTSQNVSFDPSYFIDFQRHKVSCLFTFRDYQKINQVFYSGPCLHELCWYSKLD